MRMKINISNDSFIIMYVLSYKNQGSLNLFNNPKTIESPCHKTVFKGFFSEQ